MHHKNDDPKTQRKSATQRLKTQIRMFKNSPQSPPAAMILPSLKAPILGTLHQTRRSSPTPSRLLLGLPNGRGQSVSHSVCLSAVDETGNSSNSDHRSTLPCITPKGPNAQIDRRRAQKRHYRRVFVLLHTKSVQISNPLRAGRGCGS